MKPPFHFTYLLSSVLLRNFSPPIILTVARFCDRCTSWNFLDSSFSKRKRKVDFCWQSHTVIWHLTHQSIQVCVLNFILKTSRAYWRKLAELRKTFSWLRRKNKMNCESISFSFTFKHKNTTDLRYFYFADFVNASCSFSLWHSTWFSPSFNQIWQHHHYSKNIPNLSQHFKTMWNRINICFKAELSICLTLIKNFLKFWWILQLYSVIDWSDVSL